jgi:hypothetical protein
MHGRAERNIPRISLKLDEKEPLENLGLDERIILKCVAKLRGLKMWTGLIWLRMVSSI